MNIPQFPLSKFGSVFGAMKILEENCVFISSPLDLNDSFEMRPQWTQPLEDVRHSRRVSLEHAIAGRSFHVITDNGIQMNAGRLAPATSEYLAKFAPKMDVNNQIGIAEGYNYPVAQYLHETYRILSLVERMVDTSLGDQSSHWGDVLMWSHYGDMFQGAVVLLDPAHFPTGADNPTEQKGFPIDYCLDRVSLPQWVYDYLGVSEGPGSRPIVISPEQGDELDAIMTKLLTTKSKCWEYERELRLLYPMDMVTTPDFFPEKNVPAEGVDSWRDAVTIDARAIVGVVFGPEVTTDSLKLIRPILTASRYEHLKLYRSAHNGQKYGLDYMEDTFENIWTFTCEHTKNVAMIKNHYSFKDNTVPKNGAKKTVNFNRRRPYPEGQQLS